MHQQRRLSSLLRARNYHASISNPKRCTMNDQGARSNRTRHCELAYESHQRGPDGPAPAWRQNPHLGPVWVDDVEQFELSVEDHLGVVEGLPHRKAYQSSVQGETIDVAAIRPRSPPERVHVLTGIHHDRDVAIRRAAVGDRELRTQELFQPTQLCRIGSRHGHGQVPVLKIPAMPVDWGLEHYDTWAHSGDARRPETRPRAWRKSAFRRRIGTQTPPVSFRT